MKINRKDLLVIGIAGVVALAALASILADLWRFAAAFLVALQVIGLAVALDVHRRLRNSADAQVEAASVLSRLEDAATNVSLRVVTEAQATQRAIEGLRQE